MNQAWTGLLQRVTWTPCMTNGLHSVGGFRPNDTDVVVAIDVTVKDIIKVDT